MAIENHPGRETQPMQYFAYGSNMSVPRLRSRVPSAQPLAVARLSAHRLAFHKVGSDGSAKCDAYCTQARDDVVMGVVFAISPEEKPWLDRVEGLGHGYELKTVAVETVQGTTLKAFTYYATRIDPGLQPYQWYREHVLRGAREHGLPASYVEVIETQPARSDPDPLRHERELRIYD